MIVYYQKSTKKILTVANHDSKNHLDDEQLETELNSMFPNMEDDVGVSRFEETENTEASCGGTWDPEKNIQTAPPPVQVNPDKDRLEALKTKFGNGIATLNEIQEYLFKTG